MKKYYLAIVIFLMTLAVKGQDYKPLVIEGNEWRNLISQDAFALKSTNCLKNTNDWMYSTEMLKLHSDTVIDSMSYKKLFLSYDTVSSSQLIGFMREDLINKKVYYREVGQDEFLYYDFNVNISDTVHTKSHNNFDENVVVEIDSVFVDSKYHQQIRLSTGNIWIEGIGGLFGILTSYEPLALCGSKYKDLLCFFNNGSLIYKPENSTFDKCYYPMHYKPDRISIVPLEDSFKLFPNPTKDFLRISTDNLDYFSIDLIDIHGKTLLSKCNNLQNVDLKLNQLHSGLYFVRISNQYGVYTYKVNILK